MSATHQHTTGQLYYLVTNFAKSLSKSVHNLWRSLPTDKNTERFEHNHDLFQRANQEENGEENKDMLQNYALCFSFHDCWVSLYAGIKGETLTRSSRITIRSHCLLMCSFVDLVSSLLRYHSVFLCSIPLNFLFYFGFGQLCHWCFLDP